MVFTVLPSIVEPTTKPAGSEAAVELTVGLPVVLVKPVNVPLAPAMLLSEEMLKVPPVTQVAPE